jgi:hypothetical protein
MKHLKPVLLISALTASFIAVAISTLSQSTTFVSKAEKYSLSLPSGWSTVLRESGTAFVDMNGMTRFELLTFSDREMSQEFLVSDTLKERIRESYHESYETPKETIDVFVENNTLIVDYEPDTNQLSYINSLSGSTFSPKHIREVYMLRSGVTYLFRFDSTNKALSEKILREFRFQE